MPAAAQLIPFRIPAEWTSPATLELLKGTPFNCVLDAGTLSGAARDLGLEVLESGRLPGEIVIIKTAKWPRVLGGRRSGADDADRERAATAAGPTGTPWVDSNGWLVKLNAHLHPGKAIWLDEKPRGTLLPPAYPLAISDAAYAGGRWIVTLDSDAASGVAKGDPKALESWKSLVQAARFFHAWKVYEDEPAVAGVYSDFQGENEAIAGEVLNLMGRRHLPVRVITPANLAADAKGLEMIVAVDRQGKLPPPPVSADRILMVAPGMEDPYMIASEAHLRLGRKHDVLRTWNAGTTNVRFTRSADGKKAHFQIVNYAMRQAGHEMSVWMKGPWSKAQWISLEQPLAGQPAQVERKNNGLEAAVPPLGVFGALQVEV